MNGLWTKFSNGSTFRHMGQMAPIQFYIDVNIAEFQFGVLATMEMHNCSIARAGISCTKKQGSIRNSSNIRWTFSQSQSMSSRKEHCLLCNDCNKKQEKNHTGLPFLQNTNNGKH